MGFHRLVRGQAALAVAIGATVALSAAADPAAAAGSGGQRGTALAAAPHARLVLKRVAHSGAAIKAARPAGPGTENAAGRSRARSDSPTTSRSGTTGTAPGTSRPRVKCVARSKANAALAKRMAGDIARRLSERASRVGLQETDTRTGITCQYHASWHFIAASAVKVIILATLLRKVQGEHRGLTAAEKGEAWLMITESDNDAATDLWNEDGPQDLQHFLDLAKMNETELNPAWGLTLLTAHDEILLLTLLTEPNSVLDKSSRVYARFLMAHVIASQRWGVPAGAPRSVRVHVKNGWLPYPSDGIWEINSVGAFTSPNRVYLIVCLTYGNPSMEYGIDTIEHAAEVIHRDLNPGKHATIPPSQEFPSWGIPDEVPSADPSSLPPDAIEVLPRQAVAAAGVPPAGVPPAARWAGTV